MGAEMGNGDAFDMLMNMCETVLKFSDFVEYTVRYLSEGKPLSRKEVMLVSISSLRLGEVSAALEELAARSVGGKENEGSQELEV